MLTAAAVKIAGGGLGNDTCNILNEVRTRRLSLSLGIVTSLY